MVTRQKYNPKACKFSLPDNLATTQLFTILMEDYPDEISYIDFSLPNPSDNIKKDKYL